MASKTRSAKGRAGLPPAPEGIGEAEAGLLPSVELVVEAGAFGAAMGAVGSAISGGLAVRSGEATAKEVAGAVARSSVSGALTLSVATVVAHMVRVRPVLGIGLIAVVGLGALALGRRKPLEEEAVP